MDVVNVVERTALGRVRVHGVSKLRVGCGIAARPGLVALSSKWVKVGEEDEGKGEDEEEEEEVQKDGVILLFEVWMCLSERLEVLPAPCEGVPGGRWLLRTVCVFRAFPALRHEYHGCGAFGGVPIPVLRTGTRMARLTRPRMTCRPAGLWRHCARV